MFRFSSRSEKHPRRCRNRQRNTNKNSDGNKLQHQKPVTGRTPATSTHIRQKDPGKNNRGKYAKHEEKYPNSHRCGNSAQKPHAYRSSRVTRIHSSI